MSENPLSDFDIRKKMLEKITVEKKGKEEGKEEVKYRYSPINTAAAVDECTHLITHNETLYFYNHKSGLYEENKRRIETWLKTQFECLVWIDEILPYTTKLKGLTEELMHQLMNTNQETEYPWNQYNGIPVANGVLVWDGERFNLEPYSHEMMFTRKIPINYNPAADTTKIKQILYDWLEDEYPYLLQIPAQALLQSLPGRKPVKKAYMLVGEANAAKSTYLDLLSDLFGAGCCARRCLQDLDARFSAAVLVGKYVNLGDDLPEIGVGVYNTLKRLTGRRTHEVEEKFKPPYEADITAVHVYTANKPPQVPEAIDRDNAWWDRWIFLRFQNTFPKKSMWYQDNVTPNLEGFLLLVLAELAEILKNEGQLQHQQEMDEVIDLWKHASTPLLQFIEAELERVRDGNIPKDELFDGLMKWLEAIPDKREQEEARKRLPVTKSALTKALVQEGIDVSTTGSRQNKIHVYRGIKWKASSMYKPREARTSTLGGF